MTLSGRWQTACKQSFNLNAEQEKKHSPPSVPRHRETAHPRTPPLSLLELKITKVAIFLKSSQIGTLNHPKPRHWESWMRFRVPQTAVGSQAHKSPPSSNEMIPRPINHLMHTHKVGLGSSCASSIVYKREREVNTFLSPHFPDKQWQMNWIMIV